MKAAAVETRSAQSHVDLTGALFVVWGGLTILIGASTLALGSAAAALIASGSGAAGSARKRLRRRRHWSRLAAILLGSIDLLLPPYGTALGLYSLWVLLREDSRKLFETP